MEKSFNNCVSERINLTKLGYFESVQATQDNFIQGHSLKRRGFTGSDDWRREITMGGNRFIDFREMFWREWGRGGEWRGKKIRERSSGNRWM